MAPSERQTRFTEINRELVEIERRRIVAFVTAREGELLEELNVLEFEEGQEFFRDRNRGESDGR